MLKALEIASSLRAQGYTVNVDVVGRSIKAQMKYANKINSEFTVVLGDDELEGGTAKLKNMQDGTVSEITLDSFDDKFERVYMDFAVAAFNGADFANLTQADINKLLK